VAVPPAEPAHPLRSPAWVAFALVSLAVPLAMMVPDAWWEPPPPLPHLARMPDALLVDRDGGSVSLHAGTPVFVDITHEPCGGPCAARTGVLAALAHTAAPPAMLSVLAAPPTDHPAQLAAETTDRWTLAWPAGPTPGDLSELHAAWVSSRATLPASALPGGGVLLVDGRGSVRGIFPANDDGIAAAQAAWSHLVAESDTSP